MNRNHHCIHQNIAELLKIVVGEVSVNVLKQSWEDLYKRCEKRLTWNVEIVRSFIIVGERNFCAFSANVEPDTPCALKIFTRIC